MKACCRVIALNIIGTRLTDAMLKGNSEVRNMRSIIEDDEINGIRALFMCTYLYDLEGLIRTFCGDFKTELGLASRC